VRHRKRVLLTVGPGLIQGKRCMTQRSLATALDRHADLFVVAAGDYDFAQARVRAYRRARGGRFESVGMIAPAADLWIVYTDGYYLDHRTLGFTKRRDFFEAQGAFHQRELDCGNVSRVVNEPCVEARTLKSWLAQLGSDIRVIPTRVFSSLDEVHDFQRAEGAIVAKLSWGGAGNGACKLSSPDDVQWFADQLGERCDVELGDYCFQPYVAGDEKRLWFAGARCVAGRVCHGRATPWSPRAADHYVTSYGPDVPGFAADLEAAERLIEVSGLDVGSVDFIGDRINEINGCGTIFTEYRNWQCIVDARPALVTYLVGLLKTL
jgi:hypothetical protein